MTLEDIRIQIDQVDQEIVALLEKRMELVSQIVAYKKDNKQPILDQSREKRILEKVENLVQNTAYKSTIRATFTDIMAQSRQYQQQYLE